MIEHANLTKIEIMANFMTTRNLLKIAVAVAIGAFGSVLTLSLIFVLFFFSPQIKNFLQQHGVFFELGLSVMALVFSILSILSLFNSIKVSRIVNEEVRRADEDRKIIEEAFRVYFGQKEVVINRRLRSDVINSVAKAFLNVGYDSIIYNDKTVFSKNKEGKSGTIKFAPGVKDAARAV